MAAVCVDDIVLPWRLAKEAGVEALVDLKLGNVVKASLKGATVVFVYLLPKVGLSALLSY